MLIVLEGCDGSGKSTLAKKLAEIMNAEVIHCTSLHQTTIHFFIVLLRSARHGILLQTGSVMANSCIRKSRTDHWAYRWKERTAL